MALPRMHPVPFALGSDGRLILNLACGATPRSLASMLRAAESEGRVAFVGIVLDAAETRNVMHRLENASAEAASHISGRRVRRTAATSRRRSAKKA